MTYAIIGTGAIGGYYGGRLAQNGNEVHFLAHSDFDEMSQALTVDSCHGSFVITRPNVYCSTADMPSVDVVLVALKTTNNHLLPELLPPLLRPDTVVVLLQNGLCVEHDLAAQVEGIQLAAGIAFICSTKTAPAHILHQDYGNLSLANFSCREPSIVEAIANDFIAAGVRTTVVEYNTGRWLKAIWNLPFNGMAVAFDTDTQTLVTRRDTLQLVRDIMHEVVAIAHALGVSNLGEEHIERKIEETQNMEPYAPSMKVDYDHHRAMEIYYLYTRPIMEADRLGVPCPHLKELERKLKAMAQAQSSEA